MNILFLGFGVVPYFRDLLNRLQIEPSLEIYQISPAGANTHLGKGVHQDFDGIDYHWSTLEEKEIPAKRILGLYDLEVRPRYATFLGLESFLADKKIDCIVVQLVYQAAFAFDEKLNEAVRRMGISVIFHSIPFETPTKEEAIDAVPQNIELQLSSLGPIGAPIKWLQLHRLYANCVRRRTLLKPVEWQTRIVNHPDLHVVYHEDGVRIYESFGVPTDKIQVVRNSTNTDEVISQCETAKKNAPPQDNNPYRMIHVGRLVGWKRVDLILTAMTDMISQFPALELIVVGDGPEKANLEEQSKSLGLSKHVKFLGAIHKADQLAPHLNASSLYILAGMGGLSINDAMCAGLPVVCSRCDGTEKFLVREGENGYFFKEGDAVSLKEKLSMAFQDTTKLKRMGRESRRIIDEEINLEIVAQNYIRAIQTVQAR